MVSIDGGVRQNICREKGFFSYYPEDDTAELICKKLGFHGLESVKSTGYKYSFRTDYSSGMYNLRECNPTCSYTESSDCESDTEYTEISCTCSANFYATDDGCIPCPENSEYRADIKDRCACKAGLYWLAGHCRVCPAYKYSAANSVECTQCPDGATSSPGSDHCVCFAGLYKQDNECRECTGNTFSVRNRTSCQECPEGTTVSLDHTVCRNSTHDIAWNYADKTDDNTEKTGLPETHDQKDQALEQNYQDDNPHPTTTALLIVILVVLLCLSCVIVVMRVWCTGGIHQHPHRNHQLTNRQSTRIKREH